MVYIILHVVNIISRLGDSEAVCLITFFNGVIYFILHSINIIMGLGGS